MGNTILTARKAASVIACRRRQAAGGRLDTVNSIFQAPAGACTTECASGLCSWHLGLSLWKGKLWPPVESTPLNWSPEICHRWLHWWSLHLCQIWYKSVHGGLLWKWMKYNENFIYLLYLFLETYYRLDPLTNFCTWGLKWCAVVLFGIWLTLLQILGVKAPKTPILGV